MSRRRRAPARSWRAAFRRAADPGGRDAARAAYLAAFGDEAPTWDVAAPTWREVPETLERRLRARGSRAEEADAPANGWQAAAAAIRADLPERMRAGWDQTLARARAAAAVVETTTPFTPVFRRACDARCSAQGNVLAAAGVLARADEVFWLPLELVRREARGETTLSRQEAERSIDEAGRPIAPRAPRRRRSPPRRAGRSNGEWSAAARAPVASRSAA